MITFDATSSSAFDANTTTFSHTTSGANRLLVVATVIDGTETISATYPQYAGISMTQAATFAPGSFRVYIHYLVAPAIGANNVVINFSAAQDIGVMVTSYTGVNQSTPLDRTTSSDDAASPIGGSITTSEAGELVVLASCDNDNVAGTRTALAGTTERFDGIMGAGAGTNGMYLGDLIGGAPGAKTITYSDASIGNSSYIIAAFKRVDDKSFSKENALRPHAFSPGLAR